MESEPHGTTIMGFRNDAGYILAHDGFITVMHKKVHKGEPKYTITETDANKYYHLAPKPNAITAVTSGLSRRMECLCEEVMKINTAKLKAGKPRGSVYETVQICEEKLYELGKLPMPRKDIVNSMIIGGFDGNTAVLYHVSQHSWNPRKVKRPIAKRFNSFWVIGGDVTTRRLIESFKLDHLTPIRIVAAVIKSAMYDASKADPHTGGLIRAILHTPSGVEDHIITTKDKEGNHSDGMTIASIRWELEELNKNEHRL